MKVKLITFLMVWTIYIKKKKKIKSQLKILVQMVKETIKKNNDAPLVVFEYQRL